MWSKEEIYEAQKKNIVAANRTDRRRKEKELQKNINLMDKFTPQQLRLIDEISFEREKKGIQTAFKLVEKYNATVDLCLRAYLYTNVPKFKKLDVENAIVQLAELINDYDSKNGVEGEINMSEAKNVTEVKEFCKKLIQEGVKVDKECLEDIYFKFPKISKASLVNMYHEAKEEVQINDAVNYILEPEVEPKKKQKKSKLKVKNLILEGEFDTYHVSQDEVLLKKADIVFKSLAEINKYKQDKIKEITNFTDEIEEALSMRK